MSYKYVAGNCIILGDIYYDAIRVDDGVEMMMWELLSGVRV